MTEYKRVREQAEARTRTKLLIFRDTTQLAYERGDFAPDIWGVAREMVALILSLNGIEIKSDDQSLPEWCRVSIDSPSRCVQKMLNANFIRVINEEEE